MKPRRACIDGQLSVGTTLIVADELSHYLQRVLRLRSGDKVEVFNGDGFNYAAEIVTLERKSLTILLVDKSAGLPPSPLHITMVQALSRGERLDYSLQKATELGVNTIQLLESERVELRLDKPRLERRIRHWQQVIRSTCEQCGRSDLPQLLMPVSLSEYLGLATTSTRLLLNPTAKQGISQLDQPQSHIEIIVGPEGGFSTAEVEQMEIAGVCGVSLGPRVLRTETAGPAAIAVLQQIFGDLDA